MDFPAKEDREGGFFVKPVAARAFVWDVRMLSTTGSLKSKRPTLFTD